MLLVDAEDDGLLKPVAALPQKGRDLLRHQLRAPVDDQRAVEVLDVVDAVLHLLAVAVELALLGAVALHVAVDMNLDHLVGSQEAVADALLQGVGEHRLPEVGDVGGVPRLLRRGGEADLGRGGEVLKDLAPGRIVRRAAPMALVDHDQVEEAGREPAIGFLIFLGAGDCLVEAQIDLVGGIDAVDTAAALDGLGARGQLGHRSAEGAKVVDHRLVDQHVAVGKEQDALPVTSLPQPPDDLEGGVGLARAGGHDEQDPILPFGDGFDRGVDGGDLVVARGLAPAVLVIVLEDDLLGLRRQALPGAIAGP